MKTSPRIQEGPKPPKSKGITPAHASPYKRTKIACRIGRRNNVVQRSDGVVVAADLDDDIVRFGVAI